ncbi:MAG: TIGR04211 family SH3 domain-containing protein [Pseudomonadota bacterium]
MRDTLRTISILCVGTILSGFTHAETLYISDELTVPLRSGPSSQHRILHRGLPSGTVLEKVGEDVDAGFTEIRTQRGTEGWIRSQYLVTQPIAKMRLAQVQSELIRVRNTLETVREENSSLSQSNASQRSAGEQSASRIDALEEELAEIKRISASALETNKENKLLNETNTRLRDELDDLAEAYDRLEANVRNEAILIGAGLILLGLIAGALIKSRPQRSAWN